MPCSAPCPRNTSAAAAGLRQQVDPSFLISDRSEEVICKNYDKYDVAARDPNVAGDDAFFRLYASVESDIELLLQKSEMVSGASAVAINVEIRRTKSRLLEEVPKLQKLAVKKVKGLSTEEFAVRNDLVLALPDRIQASPDGSAAAPKS